MAFGLRGGGAIQGGTGTGQSDFYEFNRRPGVNSIYNPTQRPTGGASTTLANNQKYGYLSSNQQKLLGIRGGASSQSTVNPNVAGRPAQLSGNGYNPNLQAIRDLMEKQRQENAKAKADSLAAYNNAKGTLDNVLPQFDNNPITQGTNALASNLLANPEGINDRTQQLAINRASNLVNAGANAAQMGLQGQLAQGGQLGGSAEQAGNAAIDRSRLASLANVGSEAEIQRGLRRNQDITNAIGVGSNLANARGQLGLGVASTGLNTLPQFMPEDLSGYAALINQDQGGLGGASGGGQIGAVGAFSGGLRGDQGLDDLKAKLGLTGGPSRSALGAGSTPAGFNANTGNTFGNQNEYNEIYREPNGNQVTGAYSNQTGYTAAPPNTAGKGFMTPSSNNPGNMVMQDQQGPVQGSGQPIDGKYDGGYTDFIRNSIEARRQKRSFSKSFYG